jgi:hypothetical protein
MQNNIERRADHAARESTKGISVLNANAALSQMWMATGAFPVYPHIVIVQQGSFLTISKGSVLIFHEFQPGGFLPPPHSLMLRSGDAVSPGLKSRKITGLSPNHGQITTLPDRLQVTDH